jgi:hypothetical protein
MENIQPVSSPFFSSWSPSILESCYGGGCGKSDLSQMNGRINVYEPEDPTATFKMFERVAAKNEPACLYSEMMKGALEPDLLSKTFFSKENVQILQNGLRAGVYSLSGEKYFLPPQNGDALSIIMRSTFLNHAKFFNDVNIRDQIEALNAKVLDYIVPQLYNSSKSYEQYLKDQSTLVVPLSRPLNHDRNYKELELKPFLFYNQQYS